MPSDHRGSSHSLHIGVLLPVNFRSIQEPIWSEERQNRIAHCQHLFSAMAEQTTITVFLKKVWTRSIKQSAAVDAR